MDLDLRADFRRWEATTIVRVGDTGLHLLVPTNRKRHLPIVIEVPTELLRELLVRRTDEPPADIAFLKEHNNRQAEIIKESKRAIQTLQMDLTARTDHLEDANRRLSELRDAYAERGVQLDRLKTIVGQENEAVSSLKLRCEAMATAIRKVLNPRDPFAVWKTVHNAFREALSSRLYHARYEHPWWSGHRWFGCPDCVPDWMLCDASDLSEVQSMVPCHVADTLDRETAAILAPALVSKKDE